MGIKEWLATWFVKKEVNAYLKGDKEMAGKPWYQSKTIWLAVLQGAAGVATALISANPALATLGWVATGKSILDIFLRTLTDQQVGSGT